jgi:hypothetical protein
MNAPSRTSIASAPRPPSGAPAPEVRAEVKNLLLSSPAFRALPPSQQQEIAHHTALVAQYLAAPQGLPGNKLPNAAQMLGAVNPGLARGLDAATDAASQRRDDFAQVNKIGGGEFKAGSAREGAEVAGLLLQKVNFPTFVANLIKGVFHAIVQSSIEQMEAYGRLVASVAKTLNDFRDENVSPNQGRDHLVEQFPDVFRIGVDDSGDSPQPRVQLRDGVDESKALGRVNQALGRYADGGKVDSLDLGDEEMERKLTDAARTHMATGRQQLLATMVLMGINRIVVTDGKISAKILYDFQARDSRKLQRSATAFDYARDAYGNVAKNRGYEGESETNYEGGKRTEDETRDASWYTKGNYKYTEQPIMTAMSAAADSTDAALQTKASLAGVVDINFKSDYLPLDKIADTGQLAQLQLAAVPGGAGAAPRGAGAAAGASPVPSTATTPAPARP